jgi:hypothetical protein
MALKVVTTVGLRVGERKPYGFDVTKFCTNYWSPGEVYAVTEVVRPRDVEDGGKGPTGLQYRVTVAGQCVDREPTWPTTAGETVVCGTVTFIAEAISNTSLKKTISSSTWSGPATITIDDDTTQSSDGEQKTAVFIEATEEFSEAVEVVNHVTFSDGHEEDFAIKVSKAI